MDKEDKIYGEYFYESLYPYSKFDFTDKSLLDIGSGSGIPGILIKLLFPKCDLTILESSTKKCNFMKELCDKLNINVNFINARAEEVKNEREKFDFVTSRAVASTKIMIELGVPFLKIGGLLIDPKSTISKQEVAQVRVMANKVGARVNDIIQSTSQNNHQSVLIIVQKTKKTDARYPRKWSQIINDK